MVVKNSKPPRQRRTNPYLATLNKRWHFIFLKCIID